MTCFCGWSPMACTLLLLLAVATEAEAAFVVPSSRPFVPRPSSSFVRLQPLNAKKKKKAQNNKKPTPSSVVDEDGPTPETPYVEPEVVKIEDIPEAQYDPDAHPIPHQPWRRGVTAGCEDPIEAPWRREAEEIIKNAAMIVGGKVLDVTWYLTRVIITVDGDFSNVEEYTTGPEIDIQMPHKGPIYYDPDDPKPEDVWEDEYPYLYERDEEEELQQKKKMYAPKDPDDDDDELSMLEDEVSVFMDKETRKNMAALSPEDQGKMDNQPKPMDKRAFLVDTAALSTIAGSILHALELEEERLDVLERHEVSLASPNYDSAKLETQAEFDAHRGRDVAVETQDPWNSNRTLKGKLLDRNSMDILINKQGRMVTIPQNFVKCVRLMNPNKKSYVKEVEGDTLGSQFDGRHF